MSILIKGMEMPTNCCQCPVNMEVCKRGYEYLLGHPELYDKRADDCPLIPIPPHGRLGDLEALAEDVEIFADENAIGKIEKEELLEMVRYAPTIIPAEEGET